MTRGRCAGWALTGLAAAALLLASASPRRGDPSTLHSEIRTPEAGQNWRLAFAPGETWELRLPLSAGRFLHLAVHQRGVDVVSRLVDPTGATLAEVDTATGANSTEEVVVLIHRGGEHRLRLKPGKRDASGAVDVEVLAYRPEIAGDSLRVSAVAAMARGHLAWIARDLAGAEAAFRDALPLLAELGDHPREAEARQFLGLAREAGDHLTEADTELTAAQEGYRAAHREADEALTSNQLGRVERHLGRPVAAEAAYRRALAVAQRAKVESQEASALHNLGLLAEQRGELEEALDQFEAALAIRRRTGPPAETALVLGRLGSLYMLIGRDADAMVLLQEARTLAESRGKPRDVAAALDDLGWAHYLGGQGEEALGDYAAATGLAEQAGDEALKIDLVSRRASVLRSLGRRDEARRDLQVVLAYRRAHSERTGEGYALCNLGWVELEAGHRDEARRNLEQAVEILRGRDHGEAWYYAHLGLGRVERQAERWEEARRHLETAIDALEAMRGGLSSRLSRDFVVSVRFEAYEEVIGLSMDLDRREPGKGHDREALEVAERSRARGLLEDLTDRGRQEPGRTESDPLRHVRELEMKRLDLQRAAPASPRLSELDDELRRLWLAAERSPALAASPAGAVRHATVQEMQGLLDEGSLFAVFSLGEPRSYLWIVDRRAVRAFRLDGRRELSELARDTVLAMAATREVTASDTARRRARALSQALLGSAAVALHGRRLIVVPDGALYLVPFAALPDPTPGAADDALLLDRFELVSLPSISVLAVQRRRHAGRSAPVRAAVLADPVYGADDSRLAGRQVVGSLPPDLERSISDLDLSRIDPLPNTRAEAEAIERRLPPGSTLVAEDFAARRELALSGRLSQYPILHFAAHGLLHPVYPDLSGIVLSLVDEQGRYRDGFLRAHEVANLTLPAELVVLSACSTALGHEVRGEAPLGLAQAFFRAGSRRVLASYWNVNDRATAVLMDHFYGGLLDQGLPPAAALRRAQQALRRSGSWSEPYYWAAFHLQGDWRAWANQH